MAINYIDIDICININYVSISIYIHLINATRNAKYTLMSFFLRFFLRIWMPDLEILKGTYKIIISKNETEKTFRAALVLSMVGLPSSTLTVTLL